MCRTIKNSTKGRQFREKWFILFQNFTVVEPDQSESEVKSGRAFKSHFTDAQTVYAVFYKPSAARPIGPWFPLEFPPAMNVTLGPTFSRPSPTSSAPKLMTRGLLPDPSLTSS